MIGRAPPAGPSRSPRRFLSLPSSRMTATHASIIPAVERQNGSTRTRIVADAGYCGHNAPPGARPQGLHRSAEGGHHRCGQARSTVERRSNPLSAT